MPEIKISASILNSDLSELRKIAEQIEKNNIEYLHFDVMDGEFVENITYGSCVQAAVKPHFGGVMDTHLMVRRPDRQIKLFAEAGSDIITFHAESDSNISDTIRLIKSFGVKAGLAVKPGTDMKICTFLWVYYGYPSSSYEGISVEKMRYNCGALLAKRDDVEPDNVAGVPDSGIAHAIGYSNESGIPFSRPFIKCTPTWPRSFMPTIQEKRNLIAKMKMLPVHDLIKDQSIILIDDSIVRGTQLRETAEFLYQSGVKEVHIRPACPPLLYGCKYLNFSRSASEMDLITRRVIARLEGENVSEETLKKYADPDTKEYETMVEEIRKEMNFTTLRDHRLDDMIESVGIDPECLCTYCWNGEE